MDLLAPWDWYIPMYIALGGLGGGAFIVSYFAELAGFKRRFTLKMLDLMAVFIIIAGLVFLILDLSIVEEGPFLIREIYVGLGNIAVLGPVRGLSELFFSIPLVYLYITPNPSSVITWGTWLLTIFLICAMVFSLFDFKEAISALIGAIPLVRKIRNPLSWKGIEGLLKRPVRFIGMLTAIGVTAYTGCFVAFVTARPFWNTPLVPILFTTSGVSAGLALGELFGVYSVARGAKREKEIEEEAHLTHVLGIVDTLLIGLEIGLVFFYVLIAASSSVSAAVKSANWLLFGPLASVFYPFIILGLLAPEIIYVYLWRLDPKELRTRRTLLLTVTAAVLVIVGLLLLRFTWFMVGFPEPIPGSTIPVPGGWA